MSEQPRKPKLPNPEREPWLPPKTDAKTIQAFQDLARGTANADQQKRVLHFTINSLCCTYDLSYRPDSSRNTDFAEGKRWVGLQIIKYLHLNSMNEPE